MKSRPFFLACMALASASSSAYADDANKPAEALAALNRRIETFFLLQTPTGFTHVAAGALKTPDPAKNKFAELIAVAGRAPSDLWLLTEDARVIHDDGKRVVERFVKPCGWGDWQRESNGIGTHFYTLVVDNEQVHAIAQYRDMNTRIGGERRASLGKDGKWSCSMESLVPDLVQSSASMSWRASHNMDGDACRIRSSLDFCTSGPRFAPSHVDPVRDSIDMGIYNVGFFMYGIDDGFTVTLDEHFNGVLYRFNGLAWSPVGNVPAGIRILSVWGDDQRNVWLLGREKGKNWDDPAQALFRYDGKSLQEFRVPPGFGAQWVKGTGPRDVWFGGAGTDLYQWDGATWRKGTLPFEPSSVWAAPGGEIYVVSPVGVAHTAPLTEAKP